ncbi:MAG TPA: SRPBCC family protein [Acidimicrobiales bacterium]
MAIRTQAVSVERVVAAEPHDIFDLLCDPAQHAVIDGSGMVRASRGASTERLRLGSTFGMDMKIGPVPYRIKNTVMEFEANHLIAWCHPGKHRWRWELEAVDGGTLVRHTFDWSTARSPKVIELVGYPKRNAANMEATLERLADHFAAAD